MKHNLLFIFTFLFCVSLGAQNFQFTETDIVTMGVVPQLFEGVGKSFVENTGNEVLNLRWERNVVELTDTWSTAICDRNLCYGPDVSTQDFELPVDSIGRMDVHAYPNQTVGEGIIEIIVTNIDVETEAISTLYYFNIDPTNTNEVVRQQVKVYPNPSTGLFSIKNAQRIGNVEVYSVTGQQVKNFTYNDGQWYDITDLPKGTYVVRLIDRDGQQVITKLMNKQ